jgi:hypothetical protein
MPQEQQQGGGEALLQVDPASMQQVLGQRLQVPRLLHQASSRATHGSKSRRLTMHSWCRSTCGRGVQKEQPYVWHNVINLQQHICNHGFMMLHDHVFC